jgi:predicted nucleic-acid-binding Zn-ribbon protein
MANLPPLVDIELVDCARASANQGLAIACQQCGYGKDYQKFEAELKKACTAMGIKIDDFTDLLKESKIDELGVEVAPTSSVQF